MMWVVKHGVHFNFFQSLEFQHVFKKYKMLEYLKGRKSYHIIMG